MSKRTKVYTEPGENEVSVGLRKELKSLLDGGQAHASFDEAVKGFPAKLLGVVPENLPYSAWQIVEHLRIAQRDILEFSSKFVKGTPYKPLQWPKDYWPKHAEPRKGQWQATLHAIRADRKAFQTLMADIDLDGLLQPFSKSDKQTLFREALLIADHGSYHTGELIVIRRLLGCWK